MSDSEMNATSDKCTCRSLDSASCTSMLYHSASEAKQIHQGPAEDVRVVAPNPFIPPELDPLDMKEQRSYAHAAQRLKKRHDRSKPPKPCGCCKPWRFRHARLPKQARHSEVATANRQGAVTSGDDANVFEEEYPLASGYPSLGFPPISLVDFVIAPKKESVRQGFEFIRRPRQVLTFDGVSDTKSEVDDDWEVITTEFWSQHNTTSNSRPSYAQTVVMMGQMKDLKSNG